MAAGPMAAAYRQDEWLFNLGNGWQATKILGEGGFGEAVLWEYLGSGLSKPPVKQVVVKTGRVSQFAGREMVDDYARNKAMREGRVMKELTARRSKHILRMYGDLTHDLVDDEEVIRLFLEFCPGGDISNAFLPNNWRFWKWPSNVLKPASAIPDSTNERPEDLPEADLWEIFHCLALGISVIDRGTEDLEAPSWDRNDQGDGRHICHNDITTNNIFIGYRDGDHARVPIFKIADFGLASEERHYSRQTYIEGARFRGGLAAMAPPENWNDSDSRPRALINPWAKYDSAAPQLSPAEYFTLNNPKKGACTNIFQVGAVMWSLMTLEWAFMYEPPPKISNTHAWQRKYFHRGESLGYKLHTEEYERKYSSELRHLIMDCLCKESLNRPSSRQLQLATKRGRNWAVKKQRFPPRILRIPTLSTRRSAGDGGRSSMSDIRGDNSSDSDSDPDDDSNIERNEAFVQKRVRRDWGEPPTIYDNRRQAQIIRDSRLIDEAEADDRRREAAAKRAREDAEALAKNRAEQDAAFARAQQQKEVAAKKYETMKDQITTRVRREAEVARREGRPRIHIPAEVQRRVDAAVKAEWEKERRERHYREAGARELVAQEEERQHAWTTQRNYREAAARTLAVQEEQRRQELAQEAREARWAQENWERDHRATTAQLQPAGMNLNYNYAPSGIQSWRPGDSREATGFRPTSQARRAPTQRGQHQHPGVRRSQRFRPGTPPHANNRGRVWGAPERIPATVVEDGIRRERRGTGTKQRMARYAQRLRLWSRPTLMRTQLEKEHEKVKNGREWERRRKSDDSGR